MGRALVIGAAPSASVRNSNVDPEKLTAMERQKLVEVEPLKRDPSSGKLGTVKVHRKILLEWLREEVEVQKSCRSLPFTLVFWCVFVATQLAHRKVQTAFSLQTFTERQFEDAVAASITNADGTTATSKGIAFEDVTDLAKVYQWVDQTAVRLAWGDQREDINYISNFDRVLGGIRLQQRRLNTADCPGSSEVRDVFKATCYSTKKEKNISALARAPWQDSTTDGGTGFDMLNASALTYETGELWAGSMADEEGLYTYWLDIEQTEAEALSHTQFLRSEAWLGPATDLVIVQTVLFNPQIARALLAKFVFTLSRTGKLLGKIKMKVVPVYAYENVGAWVGDIFLSLLLLWLGIGELLKMWKIVRQGRSLKEYLHPFNALNWGCCIGGIGIAIFYAAQSAIMNELDEKLSTIPEPPVGTSYQPGSRNWGDRHKHFDELYDFIARRAIFISRAEVITFWYTLLIVVKFFEAFSANPRLAIITDTLLTAMADLIHFMIVFAAVFLNFAFGAYILFGKSIAEWSSPGKAMLSSFRAFMGDFNFSDMYKVFPVSSTVWLLSFMFLIFLVMLNMILAIILDIYAEVKERRGGKKTVKEQLTTLLMGFMLRMNGRTFAKLKELLDDEQQCKKLTTEDSMVSPSDLKTLGMKENVATKILNQVARKVKRETKQAVSKTKDKVDLKKSVSRRSWTDVNGGPQTAPAPAAAPASAAAPAAGEDPISSLRSAASAVHAPAETAPLAATETTLAPASAASAMAPATAEARPATAASVSAMKPPITPPPDLSKEGLTSFAKDLLQQLERLQASQGPPPVA